MRCRRRHSCVHQRAISGQKSAEILAEMSPSSRVGCSVALRGGDRVQIFPQTAAQQQSRWAAPRCALAFHQCPTNLGACAGVNVTATMHADRNVSGTSEGEREAHPKAVAAFFSGGSSTSVVGVAAPLPNFSRKFPRAGQSVRPCNPEKHLRRPPTQATTPATTRVHHQWPGLDRFLRTRCSGPCRLHWSI